MQEADIFTECSCTISRWSNLVHLVHTRPTQLDHASVRSHFLAFASSNHFLLRVLVQWYFESQLRKGQPNGEDRTTVIPRLDTQRVSPLGGSEEHKGQSQRRCHTLLIPREWRGYSTQEQHYWHFRALRVVGGSCRVVFSLLVVYSVHLSWCPCRTFFEVSVQNKSTLRITQLRLGMN